MRYDTTLKDLLWQGAPALLRQLTGAEARSIDTTEYPRTRARRPDFVAILETGVVFHLEIQATADADMAWRMYEYYGLIAVQHGGQPVHQCVLGLTDAVAGRMPDGISHPNLAFRYDVRSVESLDPAALLASPRADDNVLAILCRTPDIRRTARDILARLASLPDRARGDAVTRLLILSGIRKAEPLIQEEARRMGIQIDIQDNAFLRQVYEQGAAQGMAQGEARGVAQGEAVSLLRILDHRFPGSVTDVHRAHVMAAPVAQLDAWFGAVWDAESPDALLRA